MKEIIRLAVAGLMLAATPALAQGSCGNYNDFREYLAREHKEAVVGRGVTPNGLMVEFFASATGGFTVLVTRPDRMTCAVVAGEALELLNKPEFPKAPAL